VSDSIWNRIGDVATNAGKNLWKFGGEVVGGVAATARFAWDVGTAPWNDAKEYNGFIQPFKTAAAKEGGAIVKPLASAGGAVMKVPGVAPALEKINKINQEYIREPLSTFGLVQGELNSGRIDTLDYFDPDTWRRAYKGAQEISPGQAFIGAFRSAYDPKFNIYDPREREAAFKKSQWGKYLSGGVDLGVLFFGDVTLIGAKGIGAVKASQLGTGKLTNADAVSKAAEGITKAQYGEKNRFTKFLDDFTKNDTAYAISHPAVKASTNPGLLAHLLGNSDNIDDTALIWRSALGDPKALDEIAVTRADISDALKTARGDLSAVDEWKLFAAPDGSGMLPFLNEIPEVLESAKANYAALAQRDVYFQKLMEISERGGVATRTTGTLAGGIEDFIAKARATRFYDKTVGPAKVEVFQPTPFHRLYQKLSWPAKERPAGIVDFNDPDSYREVVATLNVLGPNDGPIATRPFVKNLGVIDEATSKKLLDDYMGAISPEARAVAIIQLESFGVRKIAAKYGVNEERAMKIYNEYRRARTSALQSIKDNGFMIDLDGSIIKVPLLESQTANFLPIMDFALFDNLLKRNSKSGLINAVGIGKDFTLNVVDLFQDMFKAAVLLRLGYTQRNAIDSQLRIMASVGAMASLRHLGPGLKNVLTNAVQVPARYVDKYRRLDSGLTLQDVQVKSREVINELNTLKDEIAKLEGQAVLNPDDIDLALNLSTKKLLREEKEAVYQNYADILNARKTAKPKDRIGTGTFRETTSDGQVYDLDDAFGGELGEMFRKIASSGNSFERMVDTNTDLYARKLSSKGIGEVRPTDPGYFEQWAQTLRQQFGNSVVMQKLAAGETIDDVANWLISSPAGRDLRRRLNIESREAAEYVTKASGFLDQYLPVQSGLRPKLREITPADLRTAFKDPTELPVIHGHILEENILNITKAKFKDGINMAFKFLATIPEDLWARNPLYIYLYRREAARRLDIMSGLKKDRLSLEEQQGLMMQAHKVALREMKGILFNIERKTNAAMLMKYINPFFSAQENAYKTWMKLAVANPAIVNRGYMVWNAPNNAGLVTDYEGNTIPAGKTSGNDVIWLPLPKGLTQIPGLNVLTEMGIPKGSLDILFQGGLDILYSEGNPNFFSDVFPVGPYVAVPAATIARNRPDLEESLRWAFPYGLPKNAISGFLPTWVQRASTLQAELDDPQFARSYQLIYMTEQQNAKRDGRKPVSPKKIMEYTKAYWSMRTAANLIMPFAPRFDTPYKYYMDKAREYRRLYGIEADAKFLADYPDFFEFTTTLSKNPTGVQSSVAAVRRIKENEDLVSELAKKEPRLISTITNDFQGYEFSQAAYDYLYRKRISPDAPDRFLSSQSPADAMKKTEAERGWIVYNKLMDYIDNELIDRKLTSISQKGAEDLEAYKTTVISGLARKKDAQGNPVINPSTGQFEQTAWYDDYLDSDGSKTNRVVVGLGMILENKKFMKNNGNNPTWKSVQAYMNARQSIAKTLMSRQFKTLNAKANADLRLVYDTIVNKLKNDDKMGFAYLYDRFLSQDLIYDKYLTPVAVEGNK
jgi:hypothetical protein